MAKVDCSIVQQCATCQESCQRYQPFVGTSLDSNNIRLISSTSIGRYPFFHVFETRHHDATTRFLCLPPRQPARFLRAPQHEVFTALPQNIRNQISFAWATLDLSNTSACITSLQYKIFTHNLPPQKLSKPNSNIPQRAYSFSYNYCLSTTTLLYFKRISHKL